jgi:hypothetical protein
MKRLQLNLIAVKKWQKKNPEAVRKNCEKSSREQHRKGGKYYRITRENQQKGIPWEKNKIRSFHGNKWRLYKHIIAPDSVIHHQWQPGSAEYRGVALVEKGQHQYGTIDVIEILEGDITLLTEKEIRT